MADVAVACFYYSLSAEQETADDEPEGVSRPGRNMEVTERKKTVCGSLLVVQ